eukprot:TRINITY_DN9155_c0_g1_i1.p1 TRINITY_DN9155_c0_g1~~TRINITY_DN9155_c0_g1_i1.p1  ORF type:complete len:168 (-),score=24.31 TRINITY_DN9155_c0_g1_i1:477-980(-)
MTGNTAVLLALALVPPIPCLAPMPPCSPFILMNKMIESSNLLSDIHPYYPIPPCPHGGPLQALSKGDINSVFIKDVPRHLWYELSWLLAVGLPRKWEAITGKYPVKVNMDILTEGYKHKTREPRTEQFGHSSSRNPDLFHQKKIFDQLVARNFRIAAQKLNTLLRSL